jgi:hypothetical protein
LIAFLENPLLEAMKKRSQPRNGLIREGAHWRIEEVVNRLYACARLRSKQLGVNGGGVATTKKKRPSGKPLGLACEWGVT